MSIIERLRTGPITHSAEETRALAAAFAQELPGTSTLALYGDLGVGKTTFVQGLARGFGVTGRITSPTFSLFNIHDGIDRKLVHLDAYRLDDGRQMDALLIEEFLGDRYCLAVEWPERIPEWLPRDTWHIELSIEDGESHRVRLR